ncbi:MAG: hypothetical protein A2X87_01185 [Deltaproteobacteria bacterium GWC2_42_51]|nr:MAG: hypothetical protein A2056_03165 [Deltaproteobacteria bacterium GWA2_42_85]OGP36183.1 MAG: hypothetical protein A2X87_01185 [Deltaproteobacteria bacterium GWC2_42_51]OGP38110.1 MAG: hypothetical protein A2090_11390 [Deltaproteobacteria bacterium GWD2_42_10]OGP47163.1 MAG: hypothetical protein A2022_00375 [Deltaproteobacteria bacterium GWF2_42_12]OGQ26190.1 MAG: hypothetical protein A3D29_07380 [Deltaproteobacteria bacterium RIFCSPHIGHO2_02_FULL_42_44]OGQ67632.1 MAG: hypothetical protei
MKKKSETFLKFIIIEKFFLGIVFSLLSFGILSLINKDMEKFAADIVYFFNLNTDNYYIDYIIEKIAMVKNGTIIGVSVGMVFLAALNLAMSYGLHKRRVWAEWLTVGATSLLIPFEVYEIIQEQTAIKIGVLILNITIVYYLAKHKELFKKKKSLVPEG